MALSAPPPHGEPDRRRTARGRVLHVTNMWPNDAQPHFGAFVKEQVASLHTCGGICHEVVFSRSYGELRRRTRAALERERPLCIHAHHGYSAAAVAGICRRRSVPLVVSFCGGDLNGVAGPAARRLKAIAGTRLSIAAGRKATAIIVKGAPMLARLPRRLAARALVVPNGVDTDRFHPIDRAAARRALGWDDRPAVLFAGRRCDPDKNFPLARSALERVRRELGRCDLRALEGVPHRDVPLWMNAADVVLLTSIREGSPNVIKEAMACDRPIVSVPAGDVPALLTDRAWARVVPPDADAIAGAIAELLSTPAPGGGRETIFELGLDAASIATRLTDIYESIAAGVPAERVAEGEPA